MTTIAWDGSTLAADRLASSSSGNCEVVKIRRTSDGRLVGASGDLTLMSRYLDWLELPEPRGEMPAFQSDKDDYVVALEIKPDGSVRRHEQHGSFSVLSRHATVGSGAAFARGAMAAGKTAAEAVAIAALLDSGTGSDIDTLCLPTKDELEFCRMLGITLGEYLRQQELYTSKVDLERAARAQAAVQERGTPCLDRLAGRDASSQQASLYHGLVRGQ